MVPSFKNTALIFPEISFVQFLPSLINLHSRKTSISLKPLNEKRYFKKKNAILLYFERPFK